MHRTTSWEGTHSEHYAQVLSHVDKRVPKAQRDELLEFIARYYRHIDPEDLADRRSDDLYGAALAHWNLARLRKPGEARVHVYNPTIEEHGWQSTHTIIEVINDDMPFLVDSVTMEANRQGLTLHLIVHPIVSLIRDDKGRLLSLATAQDVAVTAPGDSSVKTTASARKRSRSDDTTNPPIDESFLHLEVDRIIDRQSLDQLSQGITRVLADVRSACGDWTAMRDQMLAVINQARQHPPPLSEEEITESLEFLGWLADNNFTFLGYRSHELTADGGEDMLRIEAGSGLGLLREVGDRKVAASFAALPPEIRTYARRPELLVVTKSTSRSTVHRPGYLDHISIKRFNDQGQVCGEHRFLGLFTSAAYSTRPSDIPLLRRKLLQVAEMSGLSRRGHAGKAFTNILESYPRDELFQISEQELLETAIGILHLGDRQRLRLFVRRDPFERFLSCLIYAPRENYETALRQRWQKILLESLNGTGSEFNVLLTESVTARVLIIVRTTPGTIPPFDVGEIEKRLVAATRRWEDDLKESLISMKGEALGVELFHRFAGAFPAGYREDNSARLAVADIEQIIGLADERALAVRLYRPPEAAPGTMRFKLFHCGASVTLSSSMPMLERTGLLVLDEHPYEIQPQGSPTVWIHDFGLAFPDPTSETDVEALAPTFEEAFERIFHGRDECDHFNRLLVTAMLSADDITVLRAYAKYMRQTGFSLSQSFIESTLSARASLTRQLVALFRIRFDPSIQDDDSIQAQSLCADIEQALETVDNLSEDRVLRHYLALILATLRTNFWRHDSAGRRRAFLSLKFDPARIPGLPAPVPAYEIFVYSPRFEGVHLRGSAVARGGLRWSDRPEDFRTEVLGLMKAQMVKNTVIVPAGSKGGFVLKQAPSPADRDAWLAEGVACYKDYLRGLLDVTDNRIDGVIVPPPDTRGPILDDPYLVVAADKGTATFSDHANAVSQEYGFWLDDAFASGGSAGYDHKAMGITARGAWESVKRHFRELGIDTQTTDISVVGIGDMSGDVFGNGMLLSRHIRLVAAFDHRHIFIDPQPDVELSYEERRRLFDLPRSSWADYDAKLLSPGGGIHSRAAKSIRLSSQVQQLLGIRVASLTPTELISELLKAPVDLLFNGGIGTYVKASDEDHAQVGDRANDALRVDGRQLRCRVVGEGGNLGFTQRGRIEYALGGGRIFTDAIDNSAGVGTSDQEVNIKILLGLAITDGEMTLKQRNKLLAKMTDTVARRVLIDNYYQTQILSVTGRIAAQLLDAQQRFIRALERAGRLTRELEFLPDDDEFKRRRAAGIGLTHPERAVLLAYCKNWIYDQLLASNLPDDPWVAAFLQQYFPAELAERFGAYMQRHPLRREIIATYVTNHTINRVGSTFVHRAAEAIGAQSHEIVRAYLLSCECFAIASTWAQIDSLDNQVDDAAQAALLIEINRTLERAIQWFLRSPRLTHDMDKTIAAFAPSIASLFEQLDELLGNDEQTRLTESIRIWSEQGVPDSLARRVFALDAMYASLDIIEVAASSGARLDHTARVYFRLADRLGVSWIRDRIAALPGDHHWRMLARTALRDDLSDVQRSIASSLLSQSDSGGRHADALIADWFEQHARSLERAEKLLGELRAMNDPDESMLSVAIRELRQVTMA